MSEPDAAASRIAAWLQPLPDEAAPCGPDLEYDNAFLELNLKVAGKPESQFGGAEPPDWRAAHEIAEDLLNRSRDLRIAVTWLRAGLHTAGIAALAPGLALLAGMMETQWQHVHPLPDPDDGDPYARVNALTLLRETAGVLGDLREALVVDERTIGQISVQGVEAALGLSPARAGEPAIGKDQLFQMVAAAVAKQPTLRASLRQATEQVRALVKVSKERLAEDAPDLQPLVKLIDSVFSVVPPEPQPAGEATGDDGDAGGALAGRIAGARGLSGAVNSREEAIRAIDLVCDYMERAEPANPAPLFLRRARQLINHNFLQLMKVLAPDALDQVAKLVGIDPADVQEPE